MNIPTYGEARPVWRPSGEVETYVRQVSASERAARARQAGAPPSQPPVTLQTARRRGTGPAAPARREREGAVRHTAAPSPRPAPPPPPQAADESSPATHKTSAKPPPKTRAPRTGASEAIRELLQTSGRPMLPGEVSAALSRRFGSRTVSALLRQMRLRGVLVQDVKRGPYRLADTEPGPSALLSGASDEAAKVNTPPEDTHANLARLVVQLRDERDAARAELAELRARWRVMAKEMHLLAAQWGAQNGGAGQ